MLSGLITRVQAAPGDATLRTVKAVLAGARVATAYMGAATSAATAAPQSRPASATASSTHQRRPAAAAASSATAASARASACSATTAVAFLPGDRELRRYQA